MAVDHVVVTIATAVTSMMMIIIINIPLCYTKWLLSRLNSLTKDPKMRVIYWLQLSNKLKKNCFWLLFILECCNGLSCLNGLFVIGDQGSNLIMLIKATKILWFRVFYYFRLSRVLTQNLIHFVKLCIKKIQLYFPHLYLWLE